MNKKITAVSGILAAILSLPALAQVHAPGWFAVKHPEIKRMDALRAQAAAGGRAYTLAAQPQATVVIGASGNGVDWADLKHPELRTMARMRAEEAAREHAPTHAGGAQPAGPAHGN